MEYFTSKLEQSETAQEVAFWKRHLNQFEGDLTKHEGVKNISNEEYHKGFGYSASSIKKALKSSSHFFTFKEEEKKACYDFGNVFELALCEREGLDILIEDGTIVIFDPSKRPEPTMTFGSKANKIWKQEIYDNADLVISTEDWERVELMVAKTLANPIAEKLLKGAEMQNSYYWIDPKTGLLLKTRPDLVNKRTAKSVIITDIKTTEDASPEKFQKDFANFNYGFQATTQTDGVKIASGVEVDFYCYLVVEKQAPFNCQIYTLSTDELSFYGKAVDSALSRIEGALVNPKFIEMGYAERNPESDGLLSLTTPVWKKREIENSLNIGLNG